MLKAVGEGFLDLAFSHSVALAMPWLQSAPREALAHEASHWYLVGMGAADRLRRRCS